MGDSAAPQIGVAAEMATMAAYRVQQGGQSVGSGQAALLTTQHRGQGTDAGRAERPYQGGGVYRP